MALLMPLAGRLGDRFSPRILGFIGFVLVGAFFFQYRTLDVNTSDWSIIWPTMIRAVGIAMLIAPLTATAMNAVPKRQAGMAASMLNIVQQGGGSVGIAVLGLILHHRSAMHLSHIGAQVSSTTPIYREAMSRLIAHAHGLGYTYVDSARAAAAMLGGRIAEAASVLAFQDAFVAGALITFVTLWLVFLLPSTPVGRKTAEPVHVE
jgi:DHA2 family multidrug resistance protein